jgi:hypothetical protein
MILAVPVAGTIQVFTRHWLASYRASSVYMAPEAPASPIIRVEAGPGDAADSAPLTSHGEPEPRDRTS